MTAHAKACPCGHKICKNWLVYPTADIVGVSFTETEAKAVAELLNGMAAHPEGGTTQIRWPAHRPSQ